MIKAKKILPQEVREFVRRFDSEYWKNQHDTDLSNLLDENEHIIDELNSNSSIELNSLENMDYSNEEKDWNTENDQNVCNNGYFQFGDLSFLGLTAGGDWEDPVFFMIYMGVDDRLHAYLPTKGNQFNPISGKLIGNSTIDDDAFVKKFGYKSYDDYYDYCNKTGNLYNFFDWKLIKEEIIEKIQVV